jgi:integrase
MKVGRADRKVAYVFTNGHGSPRRQDGNMRRVFARVCDRLTLDGFTPHDLRDTFATIHLSTDWDNKLPWVSRQLGHADVQTTIRHYFKFRPTTATKAFANQIR